MLDYLLHIRLFSEEQGFSRYNFYMFHAMLLYHMISIYE